jgi:hypothetical protein
MLLPVFLFQIYVSNFFVETLPQEPSQKSGLPILTAIYLTEFGRASIDGKPLSRPQALSIDLYGNLYIADTGNNRVLKCSQEGKLLRQVGGFGWGKEQFDAPVDVWAENGLDVLIIDYNNRRLERYDKDLHYISSLYNDETAPATVQFAFPVAVAFSGHGEVLLADGEFQRIVRMNSFGKLLGSFGDYDAGEGAMASPVKIAISSRDEIFVADSARSRVVKYDYFGNYVAHLGDGLLRRPTGVALWRDGLLVADSGASRIVYLGSNGGRLGGWGEPGNLPGQFSSPLGVQVFRDRAFVLDGGNGRVQIFELKLVGP